jgi:putative spermidine/putrescine transport system permease protein
MNRLALLSDRLSAWGFFVFIGCIYIFLVLPSVFVIPMSFGGADDLTFPPRKLSLGLYEQFFHSAVWTEALGVSLRVALITALLATAFGTLAAFGLVRGTFRGKKAIGFLLLSPMLMPSVVIGLGVYFYFSFLGISGSALGLVLAHLVLTVPYVIVTVSTGLRQIDPNVELAAEIMGASPLRIFVRVVVPQIPPSLASGALFAFLVSFDEVVIAWFISGTNAATLPVVMYGTLKLEASPVIAAAATLLSSASIVICFVSAMMQKPGARNEI